jgi:hypothetical protein
VALAVLLNKQLGNTMRGACRVLRSLCGLHVTPGGLAQALARAAGKLDEEYRALLRDLQNSDAVFADETSWWVGGPGWWLWAFTNPTTTLYRVDQSRGSAVVRETLGEDFGGMLVSDCLASYDPPPYRKHTICGRSIKPGIGRMEKHPAICASGSCSFILSKWNMPIGPTSPRRNSNSIATAWSGGAIGCWRRRASLPPKWRCATV